ncbi:MAG: DMT family transporter [bacterium]|nr:DMT family transporter [bacterium]
MSSASRVAVAGTAQRLGWLFALFYVFLWASAFVPSKILAVEGQPLWMLVVRFFIAGLIMCAIVVTTRRSFPATSREWLELLALGALANAFYLGLSYLSFRQLSSGVGAILASTNPLILALLAPRFLGEALNARKVLGLLLGFAGVLAIMIERAGTGTARPQDVAMNVAGVLCAVISTILFKRIQRRHDLLVLNAVQLVGAAVILIPFALLLEGGFLPVATPELIASLTYLVIVLSVGASLLWFWMLRHGEASRVSAFYFLTPVFGLALGWLLLHEHVGPRDLLGLAAIAAGISLVQRS